MATAKWLLADIRTLRTEAAKGKPDIKELAALQDATLADVRDMCDRALTGDLVGVSFCKKLFQDRAMLAFRSDSREDFHSDC